MILALDPGLATLGYAVMRPRTGAVVELGAIESERNKAAKVSTDRARRAARLFATLWEIAIRHNVKAIAAEAVSLNPRSGVTMVASLCLAWGSIVGLAHAMNVELLEVTPKQWQHAVMGSRGKVPYEALFDALSEYVSGQVTTLRTIPKRMRNHALDAVGVGLYAALTSNPTRIRRAESRP